jgi:hypothetical protein
VLLSVPTDGFRCACDCDELTHHGHDRSLSAEGFGSSFTTTRRSIPNGIFRQRRLQRTLDDDEFFRQRLSN